MCAGCASDADTYACACIRVRLACTCAPKYARCCTRICVHTTSTRGMRDDGRRACTTYACTEAMPTRESVGQRSAQTGHNPPKPDAKRQYSGKGPLPFSKSIEWSVDTHLQRRRTKHRKSVDVHLVYRHCCATCRHRHGWCTTVRLSTPTNGHKNTRIHGFVHTHTPHVRVCAAYRQRALVRSAREVEAFTENVHEMCVACA